VRVGTDEILLAVWKLTTVGGGGMAQNCARRPCFLGSREKALERREHDRIHSEDGEAGAEKIYSLNRMGLRDLQRHTRYRKEEERKMKHH